MTARIDPTGEEKLAAYRLAIKSAWGNNGDANLWPVKLNAAMHLFVKEFGEEFLAHLTTLEQNGLTYEQTAREFYNPSRLFRVIDSVIYSMRRNRFPIYTQREVVLKLLAMTKSLKYGSEFNESGTNVIFAPEAVRQVAASLPGTTVSSAESQLIHRFCGVMWAYTEAMFFRAHDIGKEIHGPYPVPAVGNGDQIVIKEYFNLHPSGLWNGMWLLPDHHIRVVQQYSPEVVFQIDAMNHVSQRGRPSMEHLRCFTIEVDGKPRDPAVLQEYIEKAARGITAITRHIESLSWHERVEKYAEIFWLRKKPLSDLMGLPGEVPAAVRERIACGTENHLRQSVLTLEASERLALLTI